MNFRNARLSVAALLGLLTLPISSCAGPGVPTVHSAAGPDLREFWDGSRERRIPVALYGASPGHRRPLAILSPGYGMRNADYGFLAQELVRQGYLVAAIQHQLNSDPPVPSGPNPSVMRRPFWMRAVADIHLVAKELEASRMAERGPLFLAGHSHGGDIAMLFATEHPGDTRLVFSLDNRRMPFPRVSRPRICSVRSSDQQADPGVLPAPSEQAQLGMVILPLAQMRHDDMSDLATVDQKAAMIAALRHCIRAHRTGRQPRPTPNGVRP